MNTVIISGNLVRDPNVRTTREDEIMAKMSRDKGKRGELEWCRVCFSEGYECHRTAQVCGKTGQAADCIGLPGIHQEVKRRERLELYKALDQAWHDADMEGKGNIPIVAHRRNDCRWVVIMDAHDWFRLYREWEAGRINDGMGNKA